MDNRLSFKNGHFKIMQIADTQELPSLSGDTIKLISAALEREKPDFVVFSGDQIKGYSTYFKLNTEKRVRQAIEALLAPVTNRGIPFAVTYGNHDDQCGMSNAEQSKIYGCFSGYTEGNMRSAEDTGTSSFPIYSENGNEPVLQLMTVDSQGNLDLGGYKPVSTEQIEWYRKTRDSFFEENGGYLPTLVIQHIPVPEYYDVLERVPRGTKGAVRAFRGHADEYYVLPSEVIDKGGFMRECPAAPDENSGEFEAMSECGDVIGIFVGHDHINSFVASLNGVDLGYTQGCGFNVYGPGGERGVRVFDFTENNPREYTTYTVTYDELGLGKPEAFVKEFIYTHAPSSVEAVKPAIKKSLISAGAAAAAVLLYKGIRKKRSR